MPRGLRPAKTRCLIAGVIAGLFILATVFMHATSAHTRNEYIHKFVVTTVFWVGERGSSDNGHIANVASAWDAQWQTHYGGVDNPSVRRGYYPAAFTPQENPFYVALPYNDFDSAGKRKPTATACPNAGNLKLRDYSWCKNSWVAVQSGNRTTYAQWEDTGPYQDNDTTYVFGAGLPHNHIDTGAGLDVSPAVRDYLHLGDVGYTSWRFVPDQAVPAGPWEQITTSSQGDKIH